MIECIKLVNRIYDVERPLLQANIIHAIKSLNTYIRFDFIWS